MHREINDEAQRIAASIAKLPGPSKDWFGQQQIATLADSIGPDYVAVDYSELDGLVAGGRRWQHQQ